MREGRKKEQWKEKKIKKGLGKRGIMNKASSNGERKEKHPKGLGQL